MTDEERRRLREDINAARVSGFGVVDIDTHIMMQLLTRYTIRAKQREPGHEHQDD